MLTRDENEILTRVGRGTPGGELLRRYWHVVAASGELSADKPIKPVKMRWVDRVLRGLQPVAAQQFMNLDPAFPIFPDQHIPARQ